MAFRNFLAFFSCVYASALCCSTVAMWCFPYLCLSTKKCSEQISKLYSLIYSAKKTINLCLENSCLSESSLRTTVVYRALNYWTKVVWEYFSRARTLVNRVPNLEKFSSSLSLEFFAFHTKSFNLMDRVVYFLISV
jgi:hypothetical protein